MPQFGILVYSPAPADSAAFTDDYLRLLDGYPGEAKKLGGKVLGGSYFSGQRGFAFEPSTAAMAVVGDAVRSGPVIESDLVPAAFFVVSAPDLDVAVRIAAAHPGTRDGAVELRQLVQPPKG